MLMKNRDFLASQQSHRPSPCQYLPGTKFALWFLDVMQCPCGPPQLTKLLRLLELSRLLELLRLLERSRLPERLSVPSHRPDLSPFQLRRLNFVMASPRYRGCSVCNGTIPQSQFFHHRKRDHFKCSHCNEVFVGREWKKHWKSGYTGQKLPVQEIPPRVRRRHCKFGCKGEFINVNRHEKYKHSKCKNCLSIRIGKRIIRKGDCEGHIWEPMSLVSNRHDEHDQDSPSIELAIAGQQVAVITEISPGLPTEPTQAEGGRPAHDLKRFLSITDGPVALYAEDWRSAIRAAGGVIYANDPLKQASAWADLGLEPPVVIPVKDFWTQPPLYHEFLHYVLELNKKHKDNYARGETDPQKDTTIWQVLEQLFSPTASHRGPRLCAMNLASPDTKFKIPERLRRYMRYNDKPPFSINITPEHSIVDVHIGK